MQHSFKKPLLTRRSVFVSLGALTVAPFGAYASVPLPASALANMPTLNLAGRTRLTFWGLKVYDAQLWVGPGFLRSKPTAASFVLDLTYLRSLKGAEIAKRSVSEMRSQSELSEADERAWLPFMQRCFKDVGDGDRLLGIHQPGQPTRFVLNGVETGSISDDRFDERFFAIWLSPKSSEPAMREALLAGVPK